MPNLPATTPAQYNEISNVLFGNTAVLVVSEINDYREYLSKSELALVENAIEKRVREFSTGRHCAHIAMQQLGVVQEPLLKGSRREPLWPDGLVGSISHCHDLAGTVVAKKDRLHSVGFDVENRKLLNPHIARHICTQKESAWLGKQPINSQGLLLLITFSVKEAIFKCVFQATGIILHFKNCEILPNLDEGTAKIEITIDTIPASIQDCQVRFYCTEQHIFSGAVLFTESNN